MSFASPCYHYTLSWNITQNLTTFSLSSTEKIMSPKALDLHPRQHPIESCTIQLHSWSPFNSPDSHTKPYSSSFHTKRPCLSDRATPSSSYQIDAIDMSRLTLFDDYRSSTKRGGLLSIARKRRRRHMSRSVSGRSSDRSANRQCCSVGASAAYATCSDFPVAAGTDSSGELFGNGDANWSDVSERNTRRDSRDVGAGQGERENLCGGEDLGQGGNEESGYGSEPGYRGDAEFGFGCGDEIDEEEDDHRLLFWGKGMRDSDTNMEMVGENTFSDQKTHHRCRRKKHDCRMADPLR